MEKGLPRIHETQAICSVEASRTKGTSAKSIVAKHGKSKEASRFHTSVKTKEPFLRARGGDVPADVYAQAPWCYQCFVCSPPYTIQIQLAREVALDAQVMAMASSGPNKQYRRGILLDPDCR